MFSDLLPRIFIHKDNGQEIRLTDPDKNLSPEEVCDSYSVLYAILATAKIVGPEFKNDTAEYLPDAQDVLKDRAKSAPVHQVPMVFKPQLYATL